MCCCVCRVCAALCVFLFEHVFFFSLCVCRIYISVPLLINAAQRPMDLTRTRTHSLWLQKAPWSESNKPIFNNYAFHSVYLRALYTKTTHTLSLSVYNQSKSARSILLYSRHFHLIFLFYTHKHTYNNTASVRL